MKVSVAGRAAITIREGRRLVAYRDSVGIWTIGVGHTGRMSGGKVYPGMKITPAQCDAFLAADLAPVERSLNGILKKPASQNQFDALASFLFNVGIGWAGVGGHAVASIFTRFNAGDVRSAAAAFDLFHSPPEITGRRNSEKKQFLTPDVVVLKPTGAFGDPDNFKTSSPERPQDAQPDEPHQTAISVHPSMASKLRRRISCGRRLSDQQPALDQYRHDHADRRRGY